MMMMMMIIMVVLLLIIEHRSSGLIWLDVVRQSLRVALAWQAHGSVLEEAWSGRQEAQGPGSVLEEAWSGRQEARVRVQRG
jgi:hypothetical protein